MAVTKRTRFEVLKRDNYTCRYCRSAEGTLTIDHVTPVSLGGLNDPSNLVAACKDCNAGKGSSTLDSEHVAEVRADALRYAELARAAYAVMVESIGRRDEYIEELAEAIDPQWSLPVGWRSSIGRWCEMGVPIEILLDAAETAEGRESVPYRQKFRYFCGIVWDRVRVVTDEVAQRVDFEGSWYDDERLWDVRHEAFNDGRDAGMLRSYRNFQTSICAGDILERHIDARPQVVPCPI